jgi:hypothetical protein
MFNGLADRVSARRVAYQRFTVLWITHWSYDTGRSDSARDFVTRVQKKQTKARNGLLNLNTQWRESLAAPCRAWHGFTQLIEFEDRAGHQARLPYRADV